MERPPEQGLGVADAHGLVAVLCGLGVLGSTCLCCLGPIRNDDLVAIVMAMGVAALWSGLFGIVTRGTAGGKALAWFGLASLVVASGVLCLISSFGGI